MRIGPDSRILFFAPHPDDETLAAGGLLQRIATAGARTKIVLVTNGDNNPWPQRLFARRWKIDLADRMLWGARRVEETLQALALLGISSDSLECLHLPDQQLTTIMLKGGDQVIRQLRAVIARNRPTLLLAPAPFDLHPDHSALHVLVRRAVSQSFPSLYYAVHSRRRYSNWKRCSLTLTPAEQETKRRAILCHRTQVVLSRRRFLQHARSSEEFWKATSALAVDIHHSICEARLVKDQLLLRIRNPGRGQILLAFENHSWQSWRVSITGKRGYYIVYDTTTEEAVAVAKIEEFGSLKQITIPMQATSLFVKLDLPKLFFDRCGWREVPCSTNGPARYQPVARIAPAIQTTSILDRS